MVPNATLMRGMYPTYAKQYLETWPDAHQDQVTMNIGGRQNLGSVAVSNSTGQHDARSLPFDLAFNKPMVFEAWDHSIIPSSRWVDSVDVALTGQQAQPGHLQAHKPEQSVNVHAPAVIRPTISTPAIIASADRRRKHPRKHACYICSNMFTSKANRDRHIRAHYGIKPSVCRCGVAFTAKSDLDRHRKGSRCAFLGHAASFTVP
ncbi:hypothetical protein EYR40_009268 [Pleurotus pulmonarius]|nr:hypothetical protein EYR36_005359 [Pleurotus pulmonarius]KAF4590337.1 hypothetical protein EYR38_009636 [Pleurotus pulmonarius]KAF4590672.1 hypothetical protein EYR40_009268 [Pleurotus pulmonarius]